MARSTDHSHMTCGCAQCGVAHALHRHRMSKCESDCKIDFSYEFLRPRCRSTEVACCIVHAHPSRKASQPRTRASQPTMPFTLASYGFSS